LKLSRHQSVSSCSCLGGRNAGEDSAQCSSKCSSWSFKAKYSFNFCPFASRY